jgi:diguanylate cyclase (GGDEF)-like protein/PAS domain S-box-containing protein
MALANCGEAAVDALVLRWLYRRFRTTVSVRSTTAAYCAGGVVGPLVAAVPALAAMSVAGKPLTGISFGSWMLAHGLGFIAIYPCTGLIAQARAAHRSILPPPGHRAGAAAALGTMALAGAASFAQETMPLLFLPVVVLMYTMALADLAVSAAALALIMIMGFGSAFLDVGPLRALALPAGERYLFLQFYVACISLTAMPVAMMLDKRRRLFAALAESETRYRMLADFSTDIIMVTGTDGVIRYVSPSIHQLGDWHPATLIGATTSTLIEPQFQAEVAQAHQSVIGSPGTTAAVEFLGVTRSRDTRWFETHMRAIQREDGVVEGVCSVVRDISKRKREEEELKAVALTDPLTNLANRRAFELLVGRDRPAGESFIALFDLDHFKRINDTFGHQAGDDVLKCFARAARGALRDTDLAARFGGEEFVIHLNDTSLAQARLICERVRAALVQEVDRRLPGVGPVTASVGISRLDGALSGVLRRADTALYEAKAAGRDCLAIAA